MNDKEIIITFDNLREYDELVKQRFSSGGSGGSGGIVDSNSTIPFTIGCDANGVYMTFEEGE